MGQSFADAHPVARELFEQANDALGFDLRKLCLEGPEDELTLTYNAQAAILTVSVIAHGVLSERVSLQPVSLAGHSLGEYSALVAAGALDFTDAVRLVHQRGRFMQEATPVGVGAMAAVLGTDAEQLQQICAEEAQGQVVGPANFNAPGQIVISGHAEAVDRVLGRVKGKRLAVSAPFHSELMRPAAERMEQVLGEVAFRDAAAPVVTNVDNALLSRAQDFPPTLVRQITAPVRWDGGIRTMIDGGVTRFVELGHGKVLAGLGKRIDKATPVLGVQDDESLAATAEALAG